jgi:multiple sugar transport system permease protein
MTFLKRFNWPVTVVITLLGLASLFPFAWMLRSSLMSNLEIYQFPPMPFPQKWRWDNFSYAVTLLPFGRYLVNTLLITVPSVVGVLFTSTMAAYAFARLEFAGKRFWFTLVVGSMLMPSACTIIPIFVAWTELGFNNTYVPLIFPAFLGGGAFNIFLCRQFLKTIPRDLDEAAYLDGAGHVTILTRVLLPLIKPVLISIALFAFVLYWNDLLGPIIYISDNDKNTISQGLANFRGGFGTDYRAIMAVCCMTVAPIVALYLIGQKYFVEGIVLSGLKS